MKHGPSHSHTYPPSNTSNPRGGDRGHRLDRGFPRVRLPGVGQAPALTLALDKLSYLEGELMTLRVTENLVHRRIRVTDSTGTKWTEVRHNGRTVVYTAVPGARGAGVNTVNVRLKRTTDGSKVHAVATYFLVGAQVLRPELDQQGHHRQVGGLGRVPGCLPGDQLQGPRQRLGRSGGRRVRPRPALRHLGGPGRGWPCSGVCRGPPRAVRRRRPGGLG